MDNKVLLICVGVCFLGLIAGTLGVGDESEMANGSHAEIVQVNIKKTKNQHFAVIEINDSKTLSEESSEDVPYSNYSKSSPPSSSLPTPSNISEPPQSSYPPSLENLSQLPHVLTHKNSSKTTKETNCTIIGDEAECVTETTTTTVNKTTSASWSKNVPNAPNVAGGNDMGSHVLLVVLFPFFIFVN